MRETNSKTIENKIIDSIINNITTNPKICKYFDGSNKLQKYTLNQILPIILFVLKNKISWRKVSELKITGDIHWNTVYKVHQKLIKYKVYEHTYEQILNVHYKKNKTKMT
jgi:hypothetical protein